MAQKDLLPSEVLCPSMGKSGEVAAFPPDREVYTIKITDVRENKQLPGDDIMIGQLANTAWLPKNGHFGHWWRGEWITTVVKMTVYEYLTEYFKHPGMNPFEDLNRLEWVSRWQDYHNVKPKSWGNQ